MPSLTSRETLPYLKILAVGESGTGKTGSLASLAEAGYKLRIIDTDEGLDSLYYALKGKPNIDVDFVTVKDKLVPVKMGNKTVLKTKGIPDGFSTAMNLLDEWKYDDVSLGKPTEWGNDTILVIDSLDFLGKMALNAVSALNGRDTSTRVQKDWMVAIDTLEDLIKMLCSPSIKCNVIINTHITWVGKDEDGNGGVQYPATLGQKLCTTIPGYFNTLILYRSRGGGQNTKRIILPQGEGSLAGKCPVPDVPKELPIETGLATLFQKALGN